ncbi:MAG TPA: substrate-binding domain-containing protein [Candidatus Baltobacteraceae bacterium]|nr:substrate-binding domain-containing protein [Candidatus Baltobacteraceae bacterium]
MSRQAARYLAAGALFIVCGAIPAARVALAADEIDVVVNKSNSVDSLTLADVKKIFDGDKGSWSNGKRITVIMLAQGSPERDAVLHDIYKMSESDYSKYFMQASFTGKVDAPPKDDNSASQVKQDVAGNPGAIGYVKASDVDGSVKVVCKLQ